MMNPFSRLSTSLLALSCFMSFPLAAQDEPVPEIFQDSLFQESIGVELVNIDAVVTDKNGQPVEGLTKGDFTLRIDGNVDLEAGEHHLGWASGTRSPLSGPSSACGSSPRRKRGMRGRTEEEVNPMLFLEKAVISRPS